MDRGAWWAAVHGIMKSQKKKKKENQKNLTKKCMTDLNRHFTKEDIEIQISI